MFFLRRPTAQRIDRFRQTATRDTFSYPEVGATLKGEIPERYNLDHNRIRLGAGSRIFEQARAALFDWKMFDIGWVKLIHPAAPIVPGQTVLVLARTFRLYSLSASRVIAMIDDDNGPMPSAAASAMARSSTMWNAAKSASASSITRRMTQSGTTFWRFPFRSIHWPVSVTQCRALLNVASPATPKQQCCELFPDAHESHVPFVTLKV